MASLCNQVIFTLLFLGCCCRSVGQGNASSLQNQLCRAHPTYIPIDPHDHNHGLVKLHRCGGACGTTASPTVQNCVVLKSNNLTMHLNDRSNQLVNHTKCGCQCVVRPSDCNAMQEWQEETCDCRYFPQFQCPEQSHSNVHWSTTAVGMNDVKRCPGNAIGQATRQCIEGFNSTQTWKIPNFSNCTSINFQTDYLVQAEAIVSGDYTPSYHASELLQVLKNATKTDLKKKEGLYGRDIDITVEILSMLVIYSQVNNNTAINSDKDQQNFLQIGSNILEPTNKHRWIQYDQLEMEKGRKTLWNRLVVTTDQYGLHLTNHMTGSPAKLIETRNIVMRLDRVTQQNAAKKIGLHFHHKQWESSLFLPAEVFSNGSDHHVVSVIYKTLNNVMRLKVDTNTSKTLNTVHTNTSQDKSEDGELPSNTTIVTSVVHPTPTGKLKEKVKIVVKNIRVLEPVPPRTCVFWREGLPSTWLTDGCSLVTSESDKHVTTCECDHLTVFAALMDPYGGPIPAALHRQALELISTIGCAISLFAVLLTILVTMFFWRTLKTPRTIVLMNLCVAIAVVCILVIVEETARNTKVGCTVIAVLLHYFLLAVFCWMLCEGLLLYYKIVQIIGVVIEEKVKYFLLFGWGFPLLIVGISLAVTQTRGYGYYGDQTACWLAVDSGLIWAFVAPAIVVLLINIVVFILVIRRIMAGTRHLQNKSRDEIVRMGVHATAVILPLLGITWLFGLLAFSSETLVFKYMFVIFNSLQGLMIFVFHCLLNSQVQGACKMKISHFSSSATTVNEKEITKGRAGCATKANLQDYELKTSVEKKKRDI